MSVTQHYHDFDFFLAIHCARVHWHVQQLRSVRRKELQRADLLCVSLHNWKRRHRLTTSALPGPASWSCQILNDYYHQCLPEAAPTSHSTLTTCAPFFNRKRYVLDAYVVQDIVDYHEHNDKSNLVLSIPFKHKHDVRFVHSFLTLFLCWSVCSMWRTRLLWVDLLRFGLVVHLFKPVVQPVRAWLDRLNNLDRTSVRCAS